MQSVTRAVRALKEPDSSRIRGLSLGQLSTTLRLKRPATHSLVRAVAVPAVLSELASTNDPDQP